MKMKKMMRILLSMLMVLSLGSAMAEPAGETMIGTITEMRDNGSFLIEQLDNGTPVQVNVPEDLTYEAAWTLGVGDVVIVSYNGIMTRSMPGQITAQAIRSASIEGIVAEVGNEQNRILIDSQEYGQVFATLPEGEKAEDYLNKTVRVFFNGIMAMSLPGQVHALTIQEVFTETGEVKEIQDQYFLIAADGNEVRVNFDDHSKLIHSFHVGDEVQVYYNGAMTMSLPGQIYAIAIANQVVLAQ